MDPEVEDVVDELYPPSLKGILKSKFYNHLLQKWESHYFRRYIVLHSMGKSQLLEQHGSKTKHLKGRNWQNLKMRIPYFP